MELAIVQFHFNRVSERLTRVPRVREVGNLNPQTGQTLRSVANGSSPLQHLRKKLHTLT